MNPLFREYNLLFSFRDDHLTSTIRVRLS
jgi:hypothetical protein